MEHVEVTDDDVVYRRIHPSQVNPATNRPSQARQLGFEVRHDPLPDTDPDGPNPAHTLVIGEKDKPKQKPARALSRLCIWVWPPEMQQFNEPDMAE